MFRLFISILTLICFVESISKKIVKPIYTGCSLKEDYKPDPFDITKYIRCSNGYSIQMKCAPRTIYSYKGKICVNCKNIINLNIHD